MWPTIDMKIEYAINQLQQDLNYLKAYKGELYSLPDSKKEEINNLLEQTYVELEEYLYEIMVCYEI